MFRRFLLIFAITGSVNGYAHYQERIPNGDNVPHPCKPNFMWKGVGHLSMPGGGERNDFGKDFAVANHEWTVDLCQKDSDGDGKTNGEELGDPTCVWKPGTVPNLVTGITHPGICDPWGSAQCEQKNSWVSCDSDEFKCPAIHEKGVQKMDLRYPWTNVPPHETSYYCMSFDLPRDDDYHMIATTPIINETKVMHHIVLLACDETSEHISTPRLCSMGLQGCTKAIGLWTLGLPGECFHEQAGFKIGLNGMKRGVLQFHWTNPEKRSDLWDASGLTIYYTKNLRKYNAGVWTTGQTYLEIPPLMPKVVQQSTCSSRCTKKIFNSSIFITTGLNHMHYLGISQYVKLMRADGSEMMLTNDEHYSYDTPVLHTYDTPVEVKPGDSLETVCTYRSMSRKKTAVYGEGTFDEMCFGIFNYFPEEAVSLPTCVGRKDYEYCDLLDSGCDFQSLRNFSNPDTRILLDKVMLKCSYAGECLHGCREMVQDVMTNHACFRHGIADAITFDMLLNRDDDSALEATRFVAALKSCDCKEENPINYVELRDTGDASSAAIRVVSALVFIKSFSVLLIFTTN